MTSSRKNICQKSKKQAKESSQYNLFQLPVILKENTRHNKQLTCSITGIIMEKRKLGTVVNP